MYNVELSFDWLHTSFFRLRLILSNASTLYMYNNMPALFNYGLRLKNSLILGLTLLKLNSCVHLHSHRWIPGEAGWKKSEYFVMSDLFEATSRIYKWANNNMRRSCAWLVDNTNVISRSNSAKKSWKNTHFLSISSCLVVQSSMRKNWWWYILGWVSYLSTHLLGNRRQCSYCDGQCSHVCPYYTCIPQGSIERAKLPLCSGVLHQLELPSQKIDSIVYGGWHGLRLCFTVWMLHKTNVKVISRSGLMMCTKCVMFR